MTIKNTFKYIKLVFISAFLIIAAAGHAIGQEQPEVSLAEYMTYQGRLTVSGQPANGTYDLQFTIENASGTPLQTVEVPGVQVTSGIFTARFLVNGNVFISLGGTAISIGVRQAPTDPYVPLFPKQPISSTPSAFRAVQSQYSALATDTLKLGGVDANQYVLTTDPRLTLAGNFIQNSAIPQLGDFNVTGTGTAGVINAGSEYRLNGSRFLSRTGVANLFLGYDSGTNNTLGIRNTFIGESTGSLNSTGDRNTFLGFRSGFSNTIGVTNTFVGAESGTSNSIGQADVMVGYYAGRRNTSGTGNVFIGSTAGEDNTTGNHNVYIGAGSGGYSAPESSDNVLVGYGAQLGPGVTNAVAIGKGAEALLSNQVVLGSSSQDTSVSGRLFITNTPSGGNAPLCIDTGSRFVTICNFTNQPKENVADLTEGLELVKRLRPVTFTSRGEGTRDVGFVESEVKDVDPRFATVGAKGVVETIKYDRITAALVKAVKEQQTQIDNQHAYIQGLQMLTQEQVVTIQKMQNDLEALKQLVCSQNAGAKVCGPEVQKP